MTKILPLVCPSLAYPAYNYLFVDTQSRLWYVALENGAARAVLAGPYVPRSSLVRPSDDSPSFEFSYSTATAEGERVSFARNAPIFEDGKTLDQVLARVG